MKRACLAVVPARWGATRFPGKPLVAIDGVPLVVRALRLAQASPAVDRVWCATDDSRIVDVVERHGFRAVRTGDHRSGTSRVAQVAADSGASVVLNVQGDLAWLPGDALAKLRGRVERADAIATLAAPWPADLPFTDAQHVKVVVGADGRAVQFTRSAPTSHEIVYLHVGVYGFRVDALADVRALGEQTTEAREDLEQLAWLDHGLPIGVALIDHPSVSVDTPADVERAVRRLKDGGS